ncbi:MAG: hypothetical protein J6D42_02225 [Clostridia bacterium]|nr:hypothetical protein [Clostridia bacterium]
MKNRFKRILSSVLCIVMLFTMLPISSLAATTNPDVLEINDGYIKVTVSGKNGGFLIDTVEGDKLDKADNNKNLLYPAKDYDTSYTSFQVTRDSGDGKTTTEEYIFGRKYGFLGLDTQDVVLTQEGNSIVATWGVKDITVKQTLTLLDETASLHGMVNVAYTVSSVSDDIVDIKMRVMYDTALGFQDYATYEVPNRLNEYTHVIKDTVIDNSGENEGDNYSGTLFAVDNAFSPTITAYTVDAVLDGKAVSPYQMAFGHWNNLASSVFEFIPKDITFTNAYSQEYMTADSAYAMYYDLGELKANEEKSFSTYYGIYSNATMNKEETVAINFPVLPSAMELKEDNVNAYNTQVLNGSDGDIQLKMMLENISDETYEKVTVVVETMNNVYPYEDYLYFPDRKGAEGGTLTEVITEFKAGEEAIIDAYFNVTPLIVSEYRRFKVLVYNTTNGDELTDARLIGTREFYLFCPGELGETIVFNTISPDVIYYEGTRNIYLSGLNFGLLKDPTTYAAILRPINGKGQDVVVPGTNIVVDTNNGTINLVVDETMSLGTYQIIFDWVDATKEDATSEMLRVQVTDDLTKVSSTYGVATIEKADDYTDKNPTYTIGLYRTEDSYKQAFKKESDRYDRVYLEFRGDFGVRRENGQIVEVRANSLTDVQGKPLSTINISNCLDVECGTVALVVDNAGKEDQVINIDIDGKVYTTNARTSVWDGVCAITSFENGDLNSMIEYDYEGNVCGDIENNIANTNAITLLWPGAASPMQTIAGMFFEFRYCQFGYMALEKGTVTNETPRMRVISFGAELSPDFLLPSNFNWGERKTSSLDVAQLALAKKNYTADQLRDVQERFAEDQKKFLDSERGSLSLYVTDILFGGGFAGFNTTIEVKLPEYFDVLPSVEGSLSLKVLPANMYRDGRIWEFGVAGAADLIMVKIEASFGMKETPAGAPAVDNFYAYVEGGFPGINIDGVGCFWIIGLGGGMSNIYDSMFVVSKLPPMTLILTTAFRIFQVLEAKATVEASLRSFKATMENVSIARVELIDEMSLEVAWYPEFFLRGHMYLDILSIIKGGGYIVIEEDRENDNYFWEAFATASVHTPDLVIIPSIKVGSVDLGVNNSKIWGALRVLKIDMGVTYYWGGDVDFAFGKYDTPEPTYPIATLAVGNDPASGRVMFMSLGTNARMSASSNGGMQFMTTGMSNPASIDSTADLMNHTINLGTYDPSKDMLLNITFSAESAAEAELIAKGNGLTRKGFVFTSEDGSSTYPLIWLDSSVNADEQPDANAMFAYDEENKKASVTISFTESSSYNNKWKLSTDVETTLGLYEIDKLPGLDGFAYSFADNKITVQTLTGYKLDTIGTVEVYAVGSDGQLYYLDEISATDPSSTEIPLPTDLPSGEYGVRIVASKESDNICSIVDSVYSFTYVNPLQPEDPTVSNIKLGGDYTIDVDVQTNSGDIDGYRTNIYVKDGSEWLPVEDFNDVIVEKDGDSQTETLTLGGKYTTVSYTDAEGNPISYTEAQNDSTSIEVKTTHSLEAGKTYRVGISAYKNDENGKPVYSNEVITSDSVVMIDAVAADVTVKAVGAKAINKIIDADSDTIDVITTQNAYFQITSDMKVSGKWTLDGGAQNGTFDSTNGTITVPEPISEGEHMLTLSGENENGDGFRVQYLFRVDCSGPALFISEPVNGAFFGGTDDNYTEETVNVIGSSEPGTTIIIKLDEETVSTTVVGESGSFSIPVVMDETRLSQTLTVSGIDTAGNASNEKEILLNNSITGVEGAYLGIFFNGEDVTNKSIPAGSSGKLELRFVAGDRSVVITEDSKIGRQIELSTMIIEGYASVEDMQLVTDKSVHGLLQATYDIQTATVVLGGNTADDPDNPDNPDEPSIPGSGSGSSSTPVTKPADPVSGSFKGTVSIIGDRDVGAGDFLFDLYKADNNFKAIGGSVQTVANGMFGSIVFNEVVFSEAGIYKYIVKANASNPIDGIIYDRDEYHITVDVRDNGRGKLYIYSQTVTRAVGILENAADSVMFEHVYMPDKTSVVIEGDTELKGNDLSAGDFEIILKSEDGSTSKAYNKADGSFSFDTLIFDKEGTYKYTVYVNASEAEDGVIYDESVYNITVKVYKNANGKLVSEVTIEKQGVGKVKEITFNNSFDAEFEPVSVDVVINNTVENIGYAQIGPEDFEFVLENVSTGEKLYGKTDITGKAVINLVFDKDDIDKQSVYKLSVVNGGRDYLEYSSDEHTLLVSVIIDDNNDLAAILGLDGKSVSRFVIDYTNVFNFNPIVEDQPIIETPDTEDTENNNSLTFSFIIFIVSVLAVMGGFFIRFVLKKR